jgi:hypothetical protein
MLLGDNTAKVSADAKGCTFSSNAYVVDVGGGVLVRVHDTAGLGEGSAGTVTSTEAITALYQLLRKLDGVNLLVYVMRVGRIVKTDQDNYSLFFKGLCGSQVPIALVLTHGDDCVVDDDDDDDPDDFAESAMGTWLEHNRATFEENGLYFRNEAVVIAKRRRFPKTYKASKKKLRRLISSSRRSTPWKMETNIWFVKMVKGYNFFGRFLRYKPAQLAPRLTSVLREHGGMSQEAAILLANQVEAGLT